MKGWVDVIGGGSSLIKDTVLWNVEEISFCETTRCQYDIDCFFAMMMVSVRDILGFHIAFMQVL